MCTRTSKLVQKVRQVASGWIVDQIELALQAAIMYNLIQGLVSLTYAIMQAGIWILEFEIPVKVRFGPPKLEFGANSRIQISNSSSKVGISRIWILGFGFEGFEGNLL